MPEYRVTNKDGEYIPYRNEPGDVPPLANFGVGYRYHITGLFHDVQGFSTQRMDEIDPWLERVNTKLEKHLDDIIMLEEDRHAGCKDGHPVVRRLGPHRPACHQAGARPGTKSGPDDPADHLAFPGSTGGGAG